MKLKAYNGNQDGSAMVIALLVMLLLMSFVALAITRTNSEVIASSNDETESRTFDASNACLEVMTRNFSKIFDNKLNPDATDLTRIAGQTPPGFEPEYSFNQQVVQTGPSRTVVMTGELFQGLNALQDKWLLNCESQNVATGVEVNVQRHFLNNRIPIFQFGIFYDDDMEFHPGPRFDFGGRVHSNANIFFAAGTGLFFNSKVTAHEEIFTNVGKNGSSYTTWGDNVNIRNASGVFVRLRNDMGSVLTSPVNGAPVTGAPQPTAYRNADWAADKGLFQGNLLSETAELRLPIKINADINGQPVDLREIVKRGKLEGDMWNDGAGFGGAPNIVPVSAITKDDQVTASERYANKTGLRVSLADFKERLPGCANAGAGVVCGVRLDADADPGADGTVTAGTPQGYRPLAMGGLPAYQATEINGERFRIAGKETWIKIETVAYNPATLTYDTVDITEDILSLGVTEQARNIIGGNTFIMDPNYIAGGTDSRSIIKLQRFMFGGARVRPAGTAYLSINDFGVPAVSQNYIVAATVPALPVGNNCANSAAFAPANNGLFPDGVRTTDARGHWRSVTSSAFPGIVGCVVPFPINMFDTREGLYNETTTVFDRAAAYGTTNVPWAGVMSMVDIDVANLRRFLEGQFDGGINPSLPAAGTKFSDANGRALRSTDIPNSNGWVFYVSDRRGDFDFDGQYDMEDIYGGNNGNLDPGEDVNRNGTLEADYVNEAVRYTGAGNIVAKDVAAVFEHRFYRRGVRLINATRLPGEYNTANPKNTRGFTVASENGVYVFGNYNATGVFNAAGASAVADFLPQGAADVPASIAADAVTILSNSWSDANSFTNAFAFNQRVATQTTTRFAMLSGDGITTLIGTPNQGGNDIRMNGGVHNYIRFLEQWPVRLNYCGSLINLFYAQNNNGQYKNGGTAVYSPPTRNWIFDASFLDINRIPPGTPFFQSIQITGFQRMN